MTVNPRTNEWRYVIATVAAFVFIPEIRRLVDFRGNFDPLNTFAVVPLLMLLPVAFFAYRRRDRIVSPAFNTISLLWFAGFGYAFFVAIAHKSVIGAAYSGVQFVLVASVGAWLLTLDEPLEVIYRRFARAIFVMGAIAGVYGIVQYVVAPPWDTLWMQNVTGTSFGLPQRFGIRVWGTLNAPGPYAMFMTAVILINLPFLRPRNLPGVAATAIMMIGLALSLVRSAWLALAIGIVLFLIFAPRRLGTTFSLALIGAASAVAFAGFIFFAPDSNFADTFTQRFSTLGNVSEDSSAAARADTALGALETALNQPFGSGLGFTGESVKLVDSAALTMSGAPAGPIDNGFVSRFFEMGYPGLAAFLATNVVSIVAIYLAFRNLLQAGKLEYATFGAACLAVETAIFLLNIAGDGQQGLLGLLFFCASAFALQPANRQLQRSGARPQALGSRYRAQLFEL